MRIVGEGGGPENYCIWSISFLMLIGFLNCEHVSLDKIKINNERIEGKEMELTHIDAKRKKKTHV